MANKTIIRKARFNHSGYTAQEMAEFGDVLADSIETRLLSGRDKHDQPTKSLGRNYARFKQRRYPPAIRNFRKTGRSLRSLGVLRANDNRVVVGLSDPVAQQRANFNPGLWGASPQNREEVADAIRRGRRVVTVKQIA